MLLVETFAAEEAAEEAVEEVAEEEQEGQAWAGPTPMRKVWGNVILTKGRPVRHHPELVGTPAKAKVAGSKADFHKVMLYVRCQGTKARFHDLPSSRHHHITDNHSPDDSPGRV